MEFPNNSKLVFKGVLFDIYQWKQKMYDGSFETFERIFRKPSVNIIATVDKKIMVLVQEQPTKPLFLSLPGGRNENRETVLKTAKRELLEETGYKASKIIIFKEFFGYSKIIFSKTLFIAKNCKKIAKQNLDSGEKIKITFLGFDDFLQLCRNKKFSAPINFKFMMYEALLDKKKKEELKNKIFN